MLQFLVVAGAGWINQQPRDVIDSLQEENRVRREPLGPGRLRVTDAQRRRQAAQAKRLGRRVRRDRHTLVTPDTLRRWHRQLIARTYAGCGRRGPSRPRVLDTIRRLIVRMAPENREWGDTRSRGARRARTNRHVALRAKIVLRCAHGESNVAVAAKLRCSNVTVGKWRQRVTTGRVDALYDEPKPGAPRTLSDADVESILVATLESKPKGRTHWSTRKMAERAGVSASTVGRIWRTFGLQPHVVESFKISDDPLFLEKVRDIVGLYLNPPDHAGVLSFDEKPQIQALERAQPILPMDMGRPERQTHNYIRHGTVDLFAALNVATGQVVAQTKKQHRSRDFVSFLREIDERVDPTLTVHVILDNLSAHKFPLVTRWVARHPRFQFHFTPTYSAWLNLVERFFGLLTEHALKRGSHSSTHALRHAISAYVDAHNDEGKPFKWTKTADEILAKVKRFGQRTVQVHGGPR